LPKWNTSTPGNSAKDRMALKMVEVAEKGRKAETRRHDIEGTSGNTGMGLALASRREGV